MPSEEGLQEAAWETSKDGCEFLRTPRDQAIVVDRDVDVYRIEFHRIESGRDLHSSVLLCDYTLGERVDWSKPYQERPHEAFSSVGDMLLEREADIALLAVLPFVPKRSHAGLLFGTEEAARAAAVAAHAALWEDAKLRLPIWAHHALKAGWTAPEGWRP